MAKRNRENETYFMRALYFALREEAEAMVKENRDSEKDLMVVATPAKRINKEEFVSAIVVANKDLRTTIPYIELFEADNGEQKSELKSIIKSIVRKEKNCITLYLGEGDDETSNFKNKLSRTYNDMIDASDKPLDDAFPSYASVGPFGIFTQIVKDTIDDLDAIIDDEMDDDDKENFRRSKGTYKTEFTKCKKNGREFSFSNGLVLSVKGFDEEDDSYESIKLDISYALKREAKSDCMY